MVAHWLHSEGTTHHGFVTTGTLAELERTSSQRLGAQTLLMQNQLGWSGCIWATSMATVESDCNSMSYYSCSNDQDDISLTRRHFSSTQSTKSWIDMTSDKKESKWRKGNLASMWDAVWCEWFHPKSGYSHVSFKVKANHNHRLHSP